MRGHVAQAVEQCLRVAWLQQQVVADAGGNPQYARTASDGDEGLVAVAQAEPAALQAGQGGAGGLEQRLEFGAFAKIDHARLLQVEFRQRQPTCVESRCDLDAVVVEAKAVTAQRAVEDGEDGQHQDADATQDHEPGRGCVDGGNALCAIGRQAHGHRDGRDRQGQCNHQRKQPDTY